MSIEAQDRTPELNKPLRGKDLNTALQALAVNRGLEPGIVNNFLNVDPTSVSHVGKLTKGVPIGLFLSYILLYANQGANALQLPNIADLPPFLHEALQAIHNIGNNAALSPALRDHLPYLALEGTAVSVGNLFARFNFLDKKARSIEKLQPEVRAQIENGEFHFIMNPRHTAAFVGNGDETANALQRMKDPGDVMLYAQTRIDTLIYQLLKSGASSIEVEKVLDRGEFSKAEKILILPVKEEDMFLPGNDGHDMTLDDIETLIDSVDRYCSTKNIPKKKVIIVGRRTISETSVESTGPNRSKKFKTSLAEKMAQVRERRETDIKIIDPTEIVMEEIVRIANGRRIRFRAKEEGDKRYRGRFYAALSEMGYKQSLRKSVRVLYNINDIPTEAEVTSDDIAVILDPTRKATLLAKGIQEKNIIVVPELTLKKLGFEVDRT